MMPSARSRPDSATARALARAVRDKLRQEPPEPAGRQEVRHAD
jgi:hypothetical protein